MCTPATMFILIAWLNAAPTYTPEWTAPGTLQAELQAAEVGDVLSWRLPADEPFSGTVTARTAGAFGSQVHRGTLSGAAGGWFIMSRHQDALYGEIHCAARGHFTVRGTADQPWNIAHSRGAQRFQCGGAVRRPAPPRAGQAPHPPRGIAGSAGLLVDVMVVYTPAAQAAAGGTSAMLAGIDAMLTYTNMVYEASAVNHRMRGVHAAEIDYVGSGNIITDLSRLRAVGDGFLDDVHVLRDTWGADLVVLIVTSGGAGVGYIMEQLSPDFEDSAFSVLSVTSGGIAFAHETGHNMGCSHNNGDGSDAVFCYAYGHRTPDDQWRTIMSYSPGEYVDFFSSPDLMFGGFPLGVDGSGCPADGADNVTTLNITSSVVSQFRESVVEVPAMSPLANALLGVIVVLAGTGVTLYRSRQRCPGRP